MYKLPTDLFEQIEAAIEYDARQDAKLAELNKAYSLARTNLVSALERGASKSVIEKVYYPTLLRRLHQLRTLDLTKASERRLVKDFQHLELRIFGEVFEYSVDRG